MDIKNLIYNTFYFRKLSEKGKKKFFDILKTKILRETEMQLVYLCPAGYGS
jgi:hypothetical protein